MSKLRDIKVLTTTAMLAAVAIILGLFKIPLGNIVEIRFASLPIGLSGYLFGPIVGGFVGAIADIGGFLVKPTGAYHPGFTIDTILTGVIFGIILHKKDISIYKILLAVVLNSLLIHLIANSFWLSVLYNLPFKATFMTRLPKEIIMVPINTIILYTIIKQLHKTKYLKIV